MDFYTFIQNSKLKKWTKCIRYTKLYKMLKVEHSKVFIFKINLCITLCNFEVTYFYRYSFSLFLFLDRYYTPL